MHPSTRPSVPADDGLPATGLSGVRGAGRATLLDWQLEGSDLPPLKGTAGVEGGPGPVVIHGGQHVSHPAVELKTWPSDECRARIIRSTRSINEQTPRGTLDLFVGGTPAAPAEAGPAASLVQVVPEAWSSRADQAGRQLERGSSKAGA